MRSLSHPYTEIEIKLEIQIKINDVGWERWEVQPYGYRNVMV